ncbi:YusG family protein [Metabacillus iocasae]|uniref:DUF2553 domain-containing protein n=1 Tax=Priestia iocasae TaxID=2291674 RepID=A0ABS2QYM3_9BACI|nr:YusG family protein [Metabacillus iocasae]MBM7704571.1 hypothetical protein [Metabacillus iocasae]
MFERKKIDITDRVTAKFNENGMKLYADKQPIGNVESNEQGNHYHLETGYMMENNRFYQYADVQTGNDQKYTDCDSEEGWC